MQSEDSLAEAKRRYDEETEKARKRAERFGKPFVAPNPFNPLLGIGSKTDVVRILKQEKGEVGAVTGFDPTTHGVGAQARAARFGIGLRESNYYEKARFEAAGLSERERALREERRKRAQRFGKDDELDTAICKAAVLALSDDPVVIAKAGAEKKDGEEEQAAAAAPAVAPTRFNALHVRAQGYLPASSRDFYAFFGETFKPQYVEWLNGVSLNVIFADSGTAKRALESFTEEMPKLIAPPADVAEKLPAINAAGWRAALKPLVKLKTDKWAPEGTQTTIYFRFATTDDTKEKAPGTTGHRTHGTFSKHGEYSLRRGGNTAMDEDSDGDNNAAAASSSSSSSSAAAAASDEVMADSAAAAADSASAPAAAASAKLTKDGKAFKYAGVKDLGLAAVSATVVEALSGAAKHLEKRSNTALPDGFRKKKAVAEEAAAAGGAGSAADGSSGLLAKRKRRERDGDNGNGGEGMADEDEGNGRDEKNEEREDVRGAKRRRSEGAGAADEDGSGQSSHHQHPLLRTAEGEGEEGEGSSGAAAMGEDEEGGGISSSGAPGSASKGRGRGHFKAPAEAAEAATTEVAGQHAAEDQL
jgi:hypothetical protein